MLSKLAWRNIWRNYRRSLIITAAISVGFAGAVISQGFTRGMGRQMIDNAIGSHMGDIQIHRQGYRINPVITLNLDDIGPLLDLARNTSGVRAAAPRVLNTGLASSPEASAGVLIVGIDPRLEPQITFISQRVIEGRYLQPGDSLVAVIGRGLAEKLQLNLDEKLVLMGQSLGPELGSGAFRVIGIFRTVSSEFDRSMVYVPIGAAQAMFSLGDRISEVVVRVESQDRLAEVLSSLRSRLDLGEYEVLSWREVAPILVKEFEVFIQFMYLFYLIIFIAVAFGVANTMLMAVFERVHELGVLMAIGARPAVVFKMVLWESALVGLVGVAVGNVLTFPMIALFRAYGLDLSMFADTLSGMGLGTVVYPYLTAMDVLSAAISVVIITILAAIYPALKAARLQPVEAIRFV
jgi:ABC-type lipoprotein release transport system permease subunit